MITTKDLTDPIGKRFQWTPVERGYLHCGQKWVCTSAWFDVECTNTRVAGWFRKRVECAVKPPTGPEFWVKRDSLRTPSPDTLGGAIWHDRVKAQVEECKAAALRAAEAKSDTSAWSSSSTKTTTKKKGKKK
jgi:hypothetical protein